MEFDEVCINIFKLNILFLIKIKEKKIFNIIYIYIFYYNTIFFKDY